MIQIHAVLGTVGKRTQTRLAGTALAAAITLLLALALPLDRLADMTSRVTLVLFALVNIALIVLKMRETKPPAGILVTPMWVPVAGALACIVTLVIDLVV